MQKSTGSNRSSTLEGDLELKAYIYQQLVDIQAYLVADSQVAVSIEEVTTPRPATLAGAKRRHKKDVLVTLTASLDEGTMEVDGLGTDFYLAFGTAKKKMLQQLTEIQNSLIDSNEREMIVQSAMNGGLTIH